MKKPIKITKSLKFDFDDLMRDVDSNYEFTLRDVVNVCVNSKIPLEILQVILRCNYIEQYRKEMKNKKIENDNKIIYLELGWNGEIDKFEGKENSSSSWDFYGMGKKGVIPEDLKEWCTKKEIAKMKKEKWQQGYAIEFTPINEIADYPIKIRKEICITDRRDYKKKKKPCDVCTRIDVQPTITLIELLHWIFWELSFLGSPAQRNGKSEDLNRRAKELDQAKKEGRLDEITVPWKDIKKILKKNSKKKKELKNESKGGRKNAMR